MPCMNQLGKRDDLRGPGQAERESTGEATPATGALAVAVPAPTFRVPSPLARWQLPLCMVYGCLGRMQWCI